MRSGNRGSIPMMTYKDYVGVFSYDPEADVFHGRVEGISDVVTFEGRSLDELRQAFHDSVEDYLAFCQELGRPPEKPASGKFLVRADEALHRRLLTAAAMAGKSLNGFVVDVLRKATESVPDPMP